MVLPGEVGSLDYDPADLDAQQAKAKAAQQFALAAELEERDDLVWILSGRRGRRVVRRQLQEAGINLHNISSSFSTNFGQMCFNEGLRERGFKWVSRILAALASGELPLDSFQKLMNETDDD